MKLKMQREQSSEELHCRENSFDPLYCFSKSLEDRSQSLTDKLDQFSI